MFIGSSNLNPFAMLARSLPRSGQRRARKCTARGRRSAFYGLTFVVGTVFADTARLVRGVLEHGSGCVASAVTFEVMRGVCEADTWTPDEESRRLPRATRQATAGGGNSQRDGSGRPMIYDGPQRGA